MSTSQSIPKTLRDLLSKLQFLGMIKKEKKPCMGDMTFVDAKSLWGAIIRAYKGEGSTGLLVHLNQIIEQTVEAIEEYKDTPFFPIIIDTLTNAKMGISNLAITYGEQPGVVSEIRVVLSNIKLQLDKHGHALESRRKLRSEKHS